MGDGDDTPAESETSPPGDDGSPNAWIHDRLQRIEQLLDPAAGAGRRLEGFAAPAWRRATRGEHRLPVTLGIAAAIALQLSLPEHLTTTPSWLLPVAEVVLVAGLVLADPGRISRRSTPLRTASLVLIALITTANAVSAVRLIVGLIEGTETETPARLLAAGAAIWLTNVIVFALWYWDLDRGGPAARARGEGLPDFVFPQMQAPDLTREDWEPEFVDYLYLSFTNATAFSPTDVMPYTRWTKMTMMTQSVISLTTVALVIARAVNILR